jgi:hypothetical protein
MRIGDEDARFGLLEDSPVLAFVDLVLPAQALLALDRAEQARTERIDVAGQRAELVLLAATRRRQLFAAAGVEPLQAPRDHRNRLDHPAPHGQRQRQRHRDDQQDRLEHDLVAGRGNLSGDRAGVRLDADLPDRHGRREGRVQLAHHALARGPLEFVEVALEADQFAVRRGDIDAGDQRRAEQAARHLHRQFAVADETGDAGGRLDGIEHFRQLPVGRGLGLARRRLRHGDDDQAADQGADRDDAADRAQEQAAPPPGSDHLFSSKTTRRRRSIRSARR